MSSLRRSRRKRPVDNAGLDSTAFNGPDADRIEDPSDSDDVYESDASVDAAETRPSTKTKRRKLVSPSAVDSLESLLPENHLFDSLFLPKIDTRTLASMWIDLYLDASDTEPLTLLVNFVLRACGSVYIFQTHDTAVIDAASASIAEIAVLFSKQKSHKFPFKSVNTFKSNTIVFFQDIVQECLDRGILVSSDENPSILQTILTWLSAFSACTIRPLRFCTTTIILTVASTLADAIKTIDSGLTKSQRQLNSASKRNTSRHNTLTQLILSYQEQRASILEIFKEVLALVLAHRYRDIDPFIRQECVKAVGALMATFPEFWFQAQYLRYIGWLLSDQDNNVRLDVSKSLLKLYRSVENTNISLGFKLFTERFKQQIIKMCSVDSSSPVRHNCVAICCELVKLGFIDSDQTNQIIAVFFQLMLKQNGPGKSSLVKIKTEVAKFISIVNVQQTNKIMDAHALFLKENTSTQFGWATHDLRIRDSVLLKHLATLLNTASEAAILENPHVYDDLNMGDATAELFTFLGQLPTYANIWETLPQLLLLDPSALEFTNTAGAGSDPGEVADFVQHVDVSLESDRAYVLGFLRGAATAIMSEDHSTGDLVLEFLARMVSYVSGLSTVAIKSRTTLEAFLKLWVVLIRPQNPAHNFYSKATELDRVAPYNHVSIQMIQCFGSDMVDTPRLIAAFGPYFDCLLANYANTASASIDILTPEISAEIRYFGAELVKDVAESSIFEPSNAVDLTELDMGRKLIEGCDEVRVHFAKLAELGTFIDINEFLTGENALLTGRLFSKLARNLSVDAIIAGWANNFLEVADSFNSSVHAVLLLEVAAVSWTIEKLLVIDGAATQREMDVLTLFANIEVLLKSLAAFILMINQAFASLSLNTNHWKSAMIEKLDALLTTSCCKFIDLVCALKVFYGKFKSENEFLNFDSLFCNGSVGSDYVRHKLPESMQDALLYLFLFKEARLAKLMAKSLDRQDQEDVNLMGLVAGLDHIEPPKPFSRQSEFDSDSEEENADREERLRLHHEQQIQAYMAMMSQRIQWKCEKDLCVYVVKLFALNELLMVDSTVIQRIELNAPALGGVYEKIITQNQQKHADKEQAPIALPHQPDESQQDPPPQNLALIDAETTLDHAADPVESNQNLLEETVRDLIEE